MSAIIDSVVLALLLIFIIVGIVRGFVKSFISSFGTIISIVLAVALASSTADFLQNAFGLTTKISNGISGMLSGLFGQELMETTLEQATEASLQSFNVANWIITIILSAKSEGLPPETTLNSVVSPVLAYYVVIIISAVALFILIKIILFLLGDLFQNLKEIKVIGITDRVLGGVLGLLEGILVVDFIILILGIIPVPAFKDLMTMIESAPFTAFLGRINVLNLIISSVVSPINVIKKLFGV